MAEARRTPPAQPLPRLIDLEPSAEDFLTALVDGLSQPRKSLPYRFLYDARGSALFDAITALPEYYPTRVETGILREHASALADHLGPAVQLVELGSGASVKVRILLDALVAPAAYVPIDISLDHLRAAAEQIQADYPALEVTAICADFAQPFDLPPSSGGRRVAFYPGSTIGNLDPKAAEAFLALWARRLGPGAALLIGVDLQKAAHILHAAYDDSQGVTAAFIRNLMVRANRELGADFAPERFDYRVEYSAGDGRVAMRLVSRGDQTVNVGSRRFTFVDGEALHIEDSWKYTIEGFHALAARAGYRPLQTWTDPETLFSVHLMQVAD